MENKAKNVNSQFKKVLTMYIEDVKEEFELKKHRGAVIETHTVYGNKYLSESNYINLKGLYIFATRNKKLTGKQIEGFIKANANTFKFLNRFVEIVPNAVEELRVNGYKKMAEIYIQQLKAEKSIEGVRKFSK